VDHADTASLASPKPRFLLDRGSAGCTTFLVKKGFQEEDARFVPGRWAAHLVKQVVHRRVRVGDGRAGAGGARAAVRRVRRFPDNRALRVERVRFGGFPLHGLLRLCDGVGRPERGEAVDRRCNHDDSVVRELSPEHTAEGCGGAPCAAAAPGIGLFIIAWAGPPNGDISASWAASLESFVIGDAATSWLPSCTWYLRAAQPSAQRRTAAECAGPDNHARCAGLQLEVEAGELAAPARAAHAPAAGGPRLPHLGDDELALDSGRLRLHRSPPRTITE